MEHIKTTLKKAAKEQLEHGKKTLKKAVKDKVLHEINKRLNAKKPQSNDLKSKIKHVVEDTILHGIRKQVKGKKPKKQHHEANEKPQKEKSEKRGTRQRQKQKQTVNVTVNNNGGDGGDVKKRQVQQIQNLATSLFNPSLVMPSYGINVRQPVNPPDPENIDFAELITRLTSGRGPGPEPQKTEPIKIKPVNVEPQKTEPIKIKPIDVEPIEPEPIKIKEPKVEPIETEPIKIKEPKVKIKPTEIQGEYLGDISDIHSKHVEDKQIHDIAAQILPKGKKPRLPKKIKDTEGLGMKIPLENLAEKVAEIGGSVAAGALTGGASLAGQALFTGGLSSLTAEAIAASLVGGGVGAGINSVVGGGPVGQILSGIAGGVAASKAVSKYRQRQAAQQEQINETTPLLINGQRLGGRVSGRSRLVPSQAEQNVDAPPSTSQQPQESLMDIVKNIATRKARQATRQMKNIGEQISSGVQNIRHKISGRNNDGRGNYSGVSDYEYEYQPPPDPLNPNEAAIKLQNAIRIRNAKQDIGKRRVRNAEFKALQDSIPLEDNNFGLDDFVRDDAATKLQNAMRVRKAKQVMTKKKNAPKNIEQLSKNALQMDKDMNKIKGLEKLIKGKQKENNITNLGELSQGILETRFKKNKQAILKQRKTVSNLGELTKMAIETNKQQIRQTDRPNLENVSAVSNLSNLSKKAISSNKQELIKGIKDTNKIKQAMKLDNAAVTIQSAVRNKVATNKFVKQMELNQQMLLRSGTITGGTRMTAKTGAQRQAAFKERHPETTALGGQITDLKRRNPEGFVDPKTLSEKQRKLNIAKEAEGVGQAKRGRPPKAAWNTSTKSK